MLPFWSQPQVLQFAIAACDHSATCARYIIWAIMLDQSDQPRSGLELSFQGSQRIVKYIEFPALDPIWTLDVADDQDPSAVGTP
jgi:hypothetical protein